MLLHVMIGKPTCLHRVGGNECDGNVFWGIDKGRERGYTCCHQKGTDGEEAVFHRPKRGTPRLKASCPRRSPYHSRAACDEQDGDLPLQGSKATAYAGPLPPILRCRSLKYRPYSCAPASCLDERCLAIRSDMKNAVRAVSRVEPWSKVILPHP